MRPPSPASCRPVSLTSGGRSGWRQTRPTGANESFAITTSPAGLVLRRDRRQRFGRPVHEPAEMLTKWVVEHLELSGFETDEADQVMRKKPPPRWHG